MTHIWILIAMCHWIFISSSYTNAVQSDIDCLKSVKESLQDPENLLSSWEFNNSTEGFICRFTGVECWHIDESRVLNIRLSDMGLKGQFPLGLKNCTSMTGLDLSSNNLDGVLPNNMTDIVNFLTSLDLSSNNFSGEIPASIGNISFLNVLKLENNRFTGQIPLELGKLNRIKEFSVAYNRLTGQVPFFLNYTTPRENYAGNLDLCGGTLAPCEGGAKKTHSSVIIGAAVGGATIAALAVGVGMMFFMRKVVRKKEEDPDENKWARSIKGTKTIKVRLLNFRFRGRKTIFMSKVGSTTIAALVIGCGSKGVILVCVGFG